MRRAVKVLAVAAVAYCVWSLGVLCGVDRRCRGWLADLDAGVVR